MFELRTLGGLELLRTGDGGVHAIPMQAKRLALLAHLAALPPNSFRRRDTLLLLFWPELDQEHARGALRQALHFLRKTVGEEAIVTRGEDEIGLEPRAVCSDARRLEAAVSAGESETALTLYRGDFLEGVFVSDAAPELEDWISAERLRLRGLAAKAAWVASELPANRENVGELVRRAVQWSGDDEGALRRGLKVLDGMGDRAGAAALYDEFARRVARDLDVQLSPETQRVIQALRARRASGQHGPPVATAPNAPVMPAPEPPTVASRVARPGKRLLLAGTAGALLVLALGAYFGPRGDTPPLVPSGVIKVMPFRVPEGDSSLAWLSDGIVEMLTARLAGAGETAGGRLVEGTVTGTRRHLIMTASLSSVSGSTLGTRAVAEGSADSVPQLVDRLAAQLLGMSAGLEGERLASVAAAPLPAVHLFVAGLAASRRANMEAAVRLYSAAVDLDSSFTLAGLQVCRSPMWISYTAQWDRGCAAARRGRDRLSPSDRAILDANPPAWATWTEMLAGLNDAIRGYPERPENWYALGDAHFRLGALSGEEGWAERAAESYQRGWLLDSALVTRAIGRPPVPEPMLHMIDLAQMRHDTAEVLRLAQSVLAVDSTNYLARVVTWHKALVTSDSARESFWSNIGSVDQKATMFIVLFMSATGVGFDDQKRAVRADQLRLRSHDPGYSSYAFIIEALNGGRPDDIVPERVPSGYDAHAFHRLRIQRALSWDGDTVAALESVRLLQRSIDAPASGEGARQQLLDLCTAGEWQASRGNYAAVAKAISRLRSARIDSTSDAGKTVRHISLCTTLLDAMLASGQGQPGAREKVVAADSLARELVFVICCAERLGDANIQIARLWEREGDHRAALRAISRRSERFSWAPLYMSTFLREEGRLAAMTGDTARAVSAYRRYLDFRHNPQTSLKPGVDSIRLQLGMLEGRD